MEIKIGVGIKNIFFGMTQDAIKAILGEPDKIFEGEVEDWTVHEYFDEMIRLIFSQEEGGRLTEIEIHRQDISLFGENVVNRTKDEIKGFMSDHGYDDLEYEDFDSFEQLSCDELRLWFLFEFNRLKEVNFAPLFDDHDEVIYPNSEQ